MRHLLLTTDFKPGVGGVAQYLHGLAEGLHQRGRRVEVVAFRVQPSPSFSPGYGLRYEPGILRRFDDRPGDGWGPTRKLNSVLIHGRRWVRGRRTVGRLLDELDAAGACVCVGLWNTRAHTWCRELRARGRPYRLFAYGREVVNPVDPLRARWRAQDFRAAETVVACSEATAELVEASFPGVTTAVVRPGVEGPRDAAAVEQARSRLRDRLNLDDESDVLVTVGRLMRRKGVHAVLEALASPELADRRVRYLVAGRGPEASRLRARAAELGVADRVAFLGHVDELTKWAVYGAGDLFMMPNSTLAGSDWEGFGIVFLEAALAGVPSVAGRSGGAVEAIDDGRTGLLVEPGSRDALAEAVRVLLDDPDRRREMGRRARRRAQELFTWERAVDRLLDAADRGMPRGGEAMGPDGFRHGARPRRQPASDSPSSADCATDRRSPGP